MPPSTSSMVAGSSPTCPAVKSRFSVRIACEYGPMAFGAFSVETIFLPSVVYIRPHIFRKMGSEAILLLIAGLWEVWIQKATHGDSEPRRSLSFLGVQS